MKRRVLIWIDTKLNDWILGGGDETISSRLGKLERRGFHWFATPVCWLLGVIDKDHCKDSIEDD